MSYKKTKAARNSKPAGRPYHYKPRLQKAILKEPLWRKVARIAFYIIITPMLILAAIHYINHYIYHVSH